MSPPGGADLREVVDKFHHDLRWKYYDAAAACVNPAHAQAFLEDVEDEKNDLNISGWEIRSVEMAGKVPEARVRVQFHYFRLPSTVVKTETVWQTWKLVGKQWLLFGQDKGPFVLPPAAALQTDPGVGADESPH